MLNTKTFRCSTIAVAIALVALLIITPKITPAPHLKELDSGGFFDAIYALGLSILVVFLAAGAGNLLIKPFRLTDWSFIERMVIAVPLGLVVISLGEFFLGLAGWIEPLHQVILIIMITIAAIKPGVDFLADLIIGWKNFRTAWRMFSLIKKVLIVTAGLALFLALLLTLTPPFDYDGLMYHLEGPRLFLNEGRIYLNLDNWFTNYPSTWEMLYMLGMGLGSDIFARLIHFITLILLVFSTYAFGKRWLPEPGGWLSTAILLGMPILLVWGTFAYTDLALALFQFTSIAIYLIWTKEKNRKFLILSGILQGAALGMKYTAGWGVIILGLFVTWSSIIEKGNREKWKNLWVNLISFGLSAAIVAAPWYIKNLIWTGSPVFPFYLPQTFIDPVEIQTVMDYLNSFGTGQRWSDYLLLPINIFTQYGRFATFVGGLDVPTPVFMLAVGYPLIRRSLPANFRKVLDILSILTVLQFLAWATGSLQSRFLIPLAPGCSILASSVILVLVKSDQKIRWRRIIITGLVSGMVFASLGTMMKLVSSISPHRVILGLESKSEFLSRTLIDFPAMEYINHNLLSTDKVFMPWDGKGYYCANKCLPDVGQAKWTVLVKENSELSVVKQSLQIKGITHLLFNESDVLFFINEHDPFREHYQAERFLREVFIPACLREVYSDDYVKLFIIDYDKVTCN